MMHKRRSHALKYINKYINKLKVKNVSKQQNTVKVKTHKAINKEKNERKELISKQN
jgi:hypothetical protein